MKHQTRVDCEIKSKGLGLLLLNQQLIVVGHVRPTDASERRQNQWQQTFQQEILIQSQHFLSIINLITLQTFAIKSADGYFSKHARLKNLQVQSGRYFDPCHFTLGKRQCRSCERLSGELLRCRLMNERCGAGCAPWRPWTLSVCTRRVCVKSSDNGPTNYFLLSIVILCFSLNRFWNLSWLAHPL